MAVFGLNLPIPTVDQKLSTLVPGNFPRPVDGIRLSVEKLRGPFGAGALDSPSVHAGDHVLIALCHIDTLITAELLLNYMCGKEWIRGQNADNVRGGEQLRTYQ